MKIKKTLFYTLTGYIAFNLATAANAQECRPLKPGTTQIEVINDTSLRKEANTTSEKGPDIKEGSFLKTTDIDNKKSYVREGGECWYKVQSFEDSQAYWIEKKSIAEDVFQSLDPTTSSNANNNHANNNENKTTENTTRQLSDYLLILLPVNLLFTILGTAFLWWFTNKKFNRLKQDIVKNRLGLKSIQDKIIEETSRLKNHSDQNTQQIVNKTTSGINQLSSLITENAQISRTDNRSLPYESTYQNPQQNDLQTWSYPDNTQNAELFNPGQLPASGQVNTDEQSSSYSTSSVLSGVIECFNKNNVKYFNNDEFILLAPISTSSLGNDGISIDAKTKINFQRTEGNLSQAPYLGFTTDGYKTYLIPNLHNGRWKQLVLNNEDKIFEFTDQSLILLEPAELVDVGDGVWRLESPVKFQ